jgi:hypothetical protein
MRSGLDYLFVSMISLLYYGFRITSISANIALCMAGLTKKRRVKYDYQAS